MRGEHKIWGNTAMIFARNDVSVHRIEAIAGGYCSEHRHRGKANLFYVESGRMGVTVWPNGAIPPLRSTEGDTTFLRAGESFTVPPGVWHQFLSPEPCVAYEVYWTEQGPLDEADIERASEGGVRS